MKEYMQSDFKEYRVTGLLYNSTKRFRMTIRNWYQANGINLWRGTVWGVLHSGKRVRLKSSYN